MKKNSYKRIFFITIIILLLALNLLFFVNWLITPNLDNSGTDCLFEVESNPFSSEDTYDMLYEKCLLDKWGVEIDNDPNVHIKRSPADM